MKKHRFLFAAALTIGATLFAMPADAATLSGLEGLGRPVSDRALDAMRGKYVVPSGITYFGIVMSSSWQGSNGITTAATLLFSVNFAPSGGGSRAVPELLVSWSRNCPSCADSSMDVSSFGPSASSGYVAITGSNSSISVGSLGTVTGVVQSQQIAGSDNQSQNVMAIEIVPSASLNYDTTGMTALGSHGESQQFDDGSTLQFTNSGHQLGVSFNDQSGTIEQSINGSVGQLAQHMFINGNGIVANNSLELMVGIDPNAVATSLNVQNALTVMKGLGY